MCLRKNALSGTRQQWKQKEPEEVWKLHQRRQEVLRFGAERGCATGSGDKSLPGLHTKGLGCCPRTLKPPLPHDRTLQSGLEEDWLCTHHTALWIPPTYSVCVQLPPENSTGSVGTEPLAPQSVFPQLKQTLHRTAPRYLLNNHGVRGGRDMQV